MAAFAAVSFAEGITFGAWLRCIAVPAANNGDETYTVGTHSWGGAPRAARLNVTAVAPDGNAGFNMGMYSDLDGTGKNSLGDEANLWVKPIDMVKVSYGQYDNGTLMGGVCLPSWDWIRPTSTIALGDEDLFMSKNNKTGLMVEVTPMENLYIQAMAPITPGREKVGDTYKKLRGGFAYTVPGLVKVKGQYIGDGAAKVDGEYKYDGTTYSSLAAATTAATAAATAANTDPTTLNDEIAAEVATIDTVAEAADGNSNCTLEAEVDVLAVEGLFVGAGFKYNVIKDGDDNKPGNEKMRVALGATYQVMPELKVLANGAYWTAYGKDAEKRDGRFQAGVGFEYDLGDGLAVNGDFRYLAKEGIDGKKTKNSDHMSFCLGAKKNVSSNGYIGVAFLGQTNSGNFTDSLPGETEKGDKFTWAIPVALSVSF
ncbi:MAG: outer membrane beta-barrel protein [Treponema sp.]|nr:outer membrane beta-barrel protein [Treponema sp.]